jgi:hypothetical protein
MNATTPLVLVAGRPGSGRTVEPGRRDEVLASIGSLALRSVVVNPDG